MCESKTTSRQLRDTFQRPNCNPAFPNYKLDETEIVSYRKMILNPIACSIHFGPAVEHEDLIMKVYNCVTKQREAAVALFINVIIAKSFTVSLSCKDRDHKKLQLLGLLSYGSVETKLQNDH